ncbi:DNA-formamidopyrimidine glycosylase family protein [Opitutus sp. ER46]|uniref:Fpg/Nei family DNA glycosylase n=1 Tax=Opitutus sp. ER46 TaxID=2161864 RepID=UPI000D325B60|nr:DNA-formamidopyrimidine glycosylase family protein [Opitutus sp. ER46]PTX96452.1 DNA-formamidopyrimidine glycosylase [Opitutus sp. ER46]
MPELAEVEFYRKRWDLAARGDHVVKIRLHEGKKLLRGVDVPALQRALSGATFVGSEARAKQMLFRFRRASGQADVWLGIHLGMTGELSVQPADYQPGQHDHLVLITARPPHSARKSASGHHALVLNDPRMFGRVQFHLGREAPAWWTRIAPALLSNAFTVEAVSTFLQRRRRAPIKAVLLMQERFPGIGNWMADEILWRAGIHPRRAAGTLTPAEVRALWRECRHVCRLALAAIAGRGDTLPPDLNVNIPRTWLFLHRWRPGGLDPRSGTPLAHATIGGRTTCWSPARQILPALRRRRTR